MCQLVLSMRLDHPEGRNYDVTAEAVERIVQVRSSRG